MFALPVHSKNEKSDFLTQKSQAEGLLIPASVFSEKKLRLGKPLGLPSLNFL